MNSPSNFSYANGKLYWDEVSGAEEYEIIFRPTSGSQWCMAYFGGNDTACDFNEAAGTYSIEGKAAGSGGWGGWGMVETVTVI